MSKHILLISYTFPPYPGIGGRRWAKFAKYLSRLGYTVHVIHAKNPFKEKSLWVKDIELNPNIKLYEAISLYPNILTVNPKSILQKIWYRIALFIVNTFSKGTPYDKSSFWKRSMLETSIDLINQFHIENVVVSCAPFSSAYHALELNKNFSDLNLVVDLRDPWTWGIGYGFANLKSEKLEYEKMMEHEVIKNCNYLLVPTSDMKDHLDITYPSYFNKTVVIPHGFDKDEVVQTKKVHSKKTRCILYGTLYDKLDAIFENLASVIKNLDTRISLDIYSSAETYKPSFERVQLINNSVNYYPQLSPQDLFSKINLYDYVLIIQPDYAKDFITTKIYEIIYSGTPILLISKKGKLSEFISNNKLGLWIIPDDISEKFESVLQFDYDYFKLKQFPIEDYSFETITSNLIPYFK